MSISERKKQNKAEFFEHLLRIKKAKILMYVSCSVCAFFCISALQKRYTRCPIVRTPDFGNFPLIPAKYKQAANPNRKTHRTNGNSKHQTTGDMSKKRLGSNSHSFQKVEKNPNQQSNNWDQPYLGRPNGQHIILSSMLQLLPPCIADPTLFSC